MLPRPALAISLAGLDRDDAAPWGGGPRAAVEWAAHAGFGAVQLDAAASGIRARDLDRSGRRDLAALLRRLRLTLSGLDLWIPPEHFADPAQAERAVGAVQGAVELASDLARLVEGSPPPTVSLLLPAGLTGGLRAEIGRAAQSSGARIADHAIPAAQGHAPTDATSAESPIGIGLDPAALLQAGQDPSASAARAGAALVSARLSDASLTGRVAPGSGRLDEMPYLASLSVAGYSRPVVLDLRGLPAQAGAARSVLTRW